MMNRQIRMKISHPTETFGNALEYFIQEKQALGAVPATLKTYRTHLSILSKWIPFDSAVDRIDQKLVNKIVSDMVGSGLAPRSIQSYIVSLRAFLSYCREQRWTAQTIRSYRAPEVIKSTYTDEELMIMLERPDDDCSFEEYRTWVIINLLVNNGCRCGTIVAIQVQDVGEYSIQTRHNKNKRVQTLPLGEEMKRILKEYMEIRCGEPTDALFCDRHGDPITENTIKCALKRYNKKRGIKSCSIHKFRHTFARKYLMDCNGDAFTLQKLLGHSTLDMTKHYCAIYDAELAKDYDRRSPLANLKSKARK